MTGQTSIFDAPMARSDVLAPQRVRRPRARAVRTDPAIGWKLFVAKNPEAWGCVVRWALKDHAARRRCSIYLYFGLLRRLDWITAGERPYKVDNRWTNACYDMLVADYPHLAGSFERRGGGASAV